MKTLFSGVTFFLIVFLSMVPAHAQSCVFSGYNPPLQFTANSYGAVGDSADLLTDGSVFVIQSSNYATPYVLDLGVWVDEEFANATTDAPSIVLSYIDHLNCIYANGQKADGLLDDVHEVSFRIHENRIKLSSTDTHNVPLETGPWVQEFHADWHDELQSKGAPAINLLLTTRDLVEWDHLERQWGYIGGASNGVGQGQAIVHVDPNLMTNDSSHPNIEDWWGDIVAHELTHAMGRGGHTGRKYDVMCCTEYVEYLSTETCCTSSDEFSLCHASWDLLVENNDNTADNYADPYATRPNPLTGEYWDFYQINNFLTTFEEKLRGDVFLAYSRENNRTQSPEFQGYGWKVHDWFCLDGETCAAGDVNGDGIEEIIAFGRRSEMKVYLAAMNSYVYQGTNFVVAEQFCNDLQVCKVADVNGDHAADLVAFTPTNDLNPEGGKGSVFVMLNNGDGTFDGIKRKWHNWFCINDEQCEVADINGDDRADLVAFDHNGTVYAAYSNGNRFIGNGMVWHQNFCYGDQVCRLGDVDGDNRDDLVAFSRSAEGNEGDVWVSITPRPNWNRARPRWNRKGAGLRRIFRMWERARPVEKWHDWFCINDEVCHVADVDGDNRDDIIAFSRGSAGDVYVATSFEGSFVGHGVKWHDWFCINDETCLLADADGDGKKDVFAFVK